jgi:hypothetical protein
MKTSELSGTALDWAVAKCEGLINGDALDVGFIREGGYTPSTNWALGGAIIEREKISLIWMQFSDEQYWLASIDVEEQAEREEIADTPLVAAMRCYVASKLGDNIEIPEGL